MKTTLLYGSVHEDLRLVEETFESLKQADYGPLGEMLEMALGGGGKLLRPALALLVRPLRRLQARLPRADGGVSRAFAYSDPRPRRRHR